MAKQATKKAVETKVADVLTIAEASELTGINAQQIRQAAKDRSIEGVSKNSDSGFWQIPKAGLEAWVTTRATRAENGVVAEITDDMADETLVSIDSIAALVGRHPHVVRKAAKAGDHLKAVKNMENNRWEITAGAARAYRDYIATRPAGTFGRSREDGRRKYEIYLTDEEFNKLGKDHEIALPYYVRRNAKLAAEKAALEASGETPAPKKGKKAAAKADGPSAEEFDPANL